MHSSTSPIRVVVTDTNAQTDHPRSTDAQSSTEPRGNMAQATSTSALTVSAPKLQFGSMQNLSRSADISGESLPSMGESLDRLRSNTAGARLQDSAKVLESEEELPGNRRWTEIQRMLRLHKGEWWEVLE